VLFLLVGSKKRKEYERKISSMVNALKLENNVRMVGFVPPEDLRKLYAASDVFALPSIEGEGFGLVVTEAMSCGKPIIGTKVGGITIQIKDGWNGFLIDPAKEKQLAEKIICLMKNPDLRKRMGLNSRKLAEQEFDYRIITQNYIRIYKELEN